MNELCQYRVPAVSERVASVTSTDVVKCAFASPTMLYTLCSLDGSYMSHELTAAPPLQALDQRDAHRKAFDLFTGFLPDPF